MISLTKTELKKLAKYPKYSQDGKGADAEIALKIFNPAGRGTWYILEAEKMENNDFLFFGYVESPITPDFNEYGYFTLSELSAVKVPLIIRDIETGEEHLIGYSHLEIDKGFDGKLIKDVIN